MAASVRLPVIPKCADRCRADDESPLTGSPNLTCGGGRGSEPVEPFGSRVADLAWIDSWAQRVRPYVCVRRPEDVLIKLPSRVFKLNTSGAMLVDRVVGGERIGDIAGSVGADRDPQRIRDIHEFFCDLRDLLANRIGEDRTRRGVDTVQYRGSFTHYPVLSEIAVTYRCNQACRFCYAGCGTSENPPVGVRRRPERRGSDGAVDDSGKASAEEMSTAQVGTVLQAIAGAARVPSVSFTGGECTLRQDLPELIRRARDLGLRVNIITNGVACASQRYVERLAAAGLHSAQVSIEGPRPEIHDRLTQRPGSLARALRGIVHLRRAGIHVHTNTTVCTANAEHLEEIIDVAVGLGLPVVSMNQIIPTGTAMLPRHGHLTVPYSQIGDIILRARRHASKVGVAFEWYSPTPLCIFNTVAHGLGSKGCAACDGLLHISPTGDILPCSSFSTSVGNILRHGFERVWFGRKARYFKRKRQAPLICRACPHLAVCQGACPLYWNGMGYGELYRAVRGGLSTAAARWIGR